MRFDSDSTCCFVRTLKAAVMICATAYFCALADDHSPVKDPGVRPASAGLTQPVDGTKPHYFASLRGAFEEVYSVDGIVASGAGLGPRFNGLSCGACHAYPDVGGSSPPRNPQFAMATAHGGRNSIPDFLRIDGPVRAVRVKTGAGFYRDGEVVPLFTVTGRSDAKKCFYEQPDFGNAANLSFRIPTPLFGASLIEGIPALAILHNQTMDSKAKEELGIFGRPNVDVDGAIGKFGWKAQHSSLERFAGEAYETEMGVRNRYSPDPREPLTEGCLALYKGLYDAPANYTGSYSSDLGEPVFVTGEFMRSLKPPEPVESFAEASAQSIERGSRLFASIGCAYCHTPALQSGNVSNGAGMNKSVARLYSDLLLHHLGPRLSDGIRQGAAGPDEFRTAPLWGLGQRLFFLHDGRTSDLLVAIEAHKSAGEHLMSEANAVVDRFFALGPAEQQSVLLFLRSL